MPDESKAVDGGDAAIRGFMILVGGAARDLTEFVAAIHAPQGPMPEMGAAGLQVLQFIAAMHDRVVADCECGEVHSLPAGFRAMLDRMAARARVVADAKADADKATFTMPHGGEA